MPLFLSRYFRRGVRIGRKYVRKITRRIRIHVKGRTWRYVKRVGKGLRVRYGGQNRRLRIGSRRIIWRIKGRWRKIRYGGRRRRRRRLRRRIRRKRRRYRRKLKRRRRRRRRQRRRRRRRRRCVLRFRFRGKWRRVYRRRKRLVFRYGKKMKTLRY